MRMFFKISYLASLAKSPTRLQKERCGTLMFAGNVVAAMSIAPLGIVVLGEGEKSFLQAGTGDLKIRQPGVATQQLAHHRFSGLHLKLKLLAVSGNAEHPGNCANFVERELAREAHLFTNCAGLDLRRSALSDNG